MPSWHSFQDQWPNLRLQSVLGEPTPGRVCLTALRTKRGEEGCFGFTRVTGLVRRGIRGPLTHVHWLKVYRKIPCWEPCPSQFKGQMKETCFWMALGAGVSGDHLLTPSREQKGTQTSSLTALGSEG